MAGMAACHLNADSRESTFEAGSESLLVRSSTLLLGTCPREHLVAAAMASGNPEFQSVYTFSWGRGFLGIEERAASADGRISEGDVRRLSASQGRRIAGLLNEIQTHYTNALNQAAGHVR